MILGRMMEAREEVLEAAEVVCSVRMVVLYAMQELGQTVSRSTEGGWEREGVLEEGCSGGRGGCHLRGLVTQMAESDKRVGPT